VAAKEDGLGVVHGLNKLSEKKKRVRKNKKKNRIGKRAEFPGGKRKTIPGFL